MEIDDDDVVALFSAPRTRFELPALTVCRAWLLPGWEMYDFTGGQLEAHTILT